jgi:hypothetical protein
MESNSENVQDENVQKEKKLTGIEWLMADSTADQVIEIFGGYELHLSRDQYFRYIEKELKKGAPVLSYGKMFATILDFPVVHVRAVMERRMTLEEARNSAK